MDEVEAHIASLGPRREPEARRLDTIFREVTGFAPKLWSGRMIGYGRYHYRYESGREGTHLASGFACAKAKITLYMMPGYEEYPEIAARLGPHTHGKSCWYINRLDAVDEGALRDLIAAALERLRGYWPVEATSGAGARLSGDACEPDRCFAAKRETCRDSCLSCRPPRA